MQAKKTIIIKNGFDSLEIFQNFTKPFLLKDLNGFKKYPQMTFSTVDLYGSYGSKIVNKNINYRPLSVDFYIKKDYLNNRQFLYNFFSYPNFEIIYYEDTLVRKIKGVLNNFEVIDNPQGEHIATVDFYCENPFFTDLNDNAVNVTEWTKDFEFPCIFQPTVIFGTRKLNGITNVINNGNINTPLIIKFVAKGSVRNPSLRNISTNELIEININMNKGDVITITTEVGNKSITLTRDGVEKDITNLLSLNSDWINLKQGDNLIAYGVDLELANLEIFVFYKNLYYGV